MKSPFISLHLLLAVCVAGIPLCVKAQDSLNVTRLGWTDLNPLENEIAISGNYAYVAAGGSGVQIVNISDPANPQNHPGDGIWNDVAICAAVGGNYLYVGYFGNGSHGMRIYSLDNPSHPQEIGNYNQQGDIKYVIVVDTLAYLGAHAGRELQILNVSNPANPILLGSLTSNYLNSGFGIAISGNYAYISDSDSGLVIINVGTPSAPTFEGYISIACMGRPAVSGNYIYVGGSSIHVIDVTDPSHPTEIGSVPVSFVFDVRVAGGCLFAADLLTGLRVFSLDNPLHPSEIGFYNPGVGYCMAVALQGGTIYAANYPFFGAYQFPVGAISRTGNAIPSGSALMGSYPNPFNSTTQIRYRIAKTGKVELRIFDVIGREVATLLDFYQNPGEYQVQFDGGNLASGTYFAQLTIGTFRQTQKLVLLK